MWKASVSLTETTSTATSQIMPTLPKEAFKLHGGCFCKAITYTVSIPELEARPLLGRAITDSFGPKTEVSERLPLISLDHCNSCRRVAGSILQCWLIIPISWATFLLLPRSVDPKSPNAAESLIITPTLDVLKGKKDLIETTYLKTFATSEQVARVFCGNCGTHLTFLDVEDAQSATKWGGYFDIAVGTLEKQSVEMDGFMPYRQGHLVDGIGWVKRLVDDGARSMDEK